MKETYKIHESSYISEKTHIGNGTVIWQNCIVLDDVFIGNNCIIGANVFIENGVKIGNGVKIKNNVAIYKGVIVEDDVFLGPNCVFTNVTNPRAFIDRKNEFKNTLIKKGATIGANATIICGHEVGKYAMIGAGAVVTKEVSDYELVVGNPAQKMGYVCECGCRMERGFICNNCDKRYLLKDGVLKQIEN